MGGQLCDFGTTSNDGGGTNGDADDDNSKFDIEKYTDTLLLALPDLHLL